VFSWPGDVVNENEGAMMNVFCVPTLVVALVTLTCWRGTAAQDRSFGCDDFATQAAAQAQLDMTPSDPYGLDPDGNGIACDEPGALGLSDRPIAASVPRESRFPDPLHADIDRFWAARFLEVGREYDPPSGVVGLDEPIDTACGWVDPEAEAAFYCVLDQTIYYATAFRSLVEEQIGDFAWVTIVAHEWGHHIQAELGFDLGIAPDSATQVAPIALEHQADCLAGAYASDAEVRGWLDPGDLQEALDLTEIAGDPVSTPVTDPPAYGTGEVRTEAFLTGYGGGLAACTLDLSQAAPAA
jgi:hypothetical protein